MKPVTSSPSELRKQIGPAVWLLFLFVRCVPSDWPGDSGAEWVAKGNIITDSELSERLGVSVSVARAWRCRLRQLGLIGWLLWPGRGRAYWLTGVAHVFDFERPQSAASSIGLESPREPAAAVWRAVLSDADKQSRLQAIEKARGNLLAHADGLNKLLFERKQKARTRGSTNAAATPFLGGESAIRPVVEAQQ